MHALTWDFDRVLVYIPVIDFPIYWYGFLFALGLLAAQRLLQKNLLASGLENESSAHNLYVKIVLSIVLGARLFDILFYQDTLYFLKKPWEIFNFRAGGLASHGGVFFYLVAMILHANKMKQPLINYLAQMIAPAGILFFFIRLGNLFNQEILGKAYQGFGAIIFQNPFDGSAAIARHPVVLYEAIACLLVGLSIQNMRLSNRKKVGLAFALFGFFRIAIEFLKEEQSVHVLPYGLTMGMLLTVPFVLWGLYIAFINQPDKQYTKSQLKHPKEV